MAMARDSASPSSHAGDDTRDRLVAATTRCLKRYGLAKTGVIDIVREAGSSRQTAYRYFSGRRELIYHAFLEAAEALLNRVQQAVEGYDDPLDVLVETLVALLRELRDDDILAQAFGPDALATLRPLTASQVATTELSNVALRSYQRSLGHLADEHRILLAEQVNRLVLSAMLLADDDSLLRADDETRRKLRAWFEPTAARHIELAKRAHADEPRERHSAKA